MPIDMSEVYREQKKDLENEIANLPDWDPKKRRVLEKIRQLDISIQHSERFKESGGKY